MGSRLHDLGIQQPRWRQEQWFGIAASVPLALRLVPHAVCMEQSPSILGYLIAREKRNVRIGDVQNPIEQQISAPLHPFTNHEGHHEPAYRCKGHPDPCVPIRLIVEPSKRYMVLLGMHKAPEFVELTFNDMES